MSLMFWRKKDALTGQESAVPVTKVDPLPVSPSLEDTDDPLRMSVDMLSMPPVSGVTITRLVKVPGIGLAAAYESGDAFGTLITFPDVFRPEKNSGVIVSAFLLDLDDEGIQKDVPIYIAPITATADTSAAAPTDADMLLCRGGFSISTFINLGSNQIGTATNINLWVSGGSPNLYTQLVTRGADNIAAANEPWIGIVVVPD